MKKIIIILASVFVVISVAFVVIVSGYLSGNGAEVQKFDLDNYDSYLVEFSSNLVYEEIKDANDAKAIAEYVWKDKFNISFLDNKPYKVFYDEESDTWFVKGTLKALPYQAVVGGVPNIIVHSDGRVLAVWHSA